MSDPIEDAMGKIAQVRAGHEAMMFDDARKTLKHNRAVVRAHAERMIGPLPVEEGDDTLQLGDNTYHIHDESRNKSLSLLSKLGWVAVGAALIALTGGSGASIWYALNSGLPIPSGNPAGGKKVPVVVVKPGDPQPKVEEIEMEWKFHPFGWNPVPAGWRKGPPRTPNFSVQPGQEHLYIHRPKPTE